MKKDMVVTVTYRQEGLDPDDPSGVITDGNRVEQSMVIGKLNCKRCEELIERFQDFAEGLKKWVLETEK